MDTNRGLEMIPDKCPNCEKHMKWINKRGTKNTVQCPMCKSIYNIIEEIIQWELVKCVEKKVIGI